MNPDFQPVVRVNGVFKRYARTQTAKRRQLLRQFGLALLAHSGDRSELSVDEFWALQDVSFEIHRGEAVGLIGMNGAGKSTLLSIIARQLLPDRGQVCTRGRAEALINLTAGFEESLTGRENVLLKGALSGRTRGEMLHSFDRIVEFAELNEFIDAPVAAYSSGMRMRLAFSIAIHSEYEVLLIDEVLSVGDFRFRQKCLNRLNSMRSNSAFIFVSHSAQDIVRFCDRALVLEQGRLLFDGEADSALKVYHSARSDADISADSERTVPDLGDLLADGDAISDMVGHFENGHGVPTAHVPLWSDLHVRFGFTLHRKCRRPVIGVTLYNDRGEIVAAINNLIKELPKEIPLKGRIELTARLPKFPLHAGRYYSVLAVYDGNVCLCRVPLSSLDIEKGSPYAVGLVFPYFEWIDDSGQKEAIGTKELASDR